MTDDGEALARHLQWRRCVTERFFEHDLAVDVDAEQAYRVGYEFPSAGIDRLADRLEHPCDRECTAEIASDCARIAISGI
ncbi:MAG: hypothetical protein ACOCQY_04080 [Halorhabdus sp.]